MATLQDCEEVSQPRERGTHVISVVHISSILQQPLGSVLPSHEGQQVK